MGIRESLGWSEFFERQLSGETRSNLQVARIVEHQRALYRVAGDYSGWGEVSGRLRHDARTAADLPAIGDWVVLTADTASDRATIQRVLDRRTKISRSAAGRAAGEQLVAANVDTVFIVTSLNEDLSANRIERYLTMVWDSGARPVVLLNKMDLCEDVPGAVSRMRTRLPFVDVHAISAIGREGQEGQEGREGQAGTTRDGLEVIAQYLVPGQTVALVGSSGVGKSTLINRMAGRDLRRVRDIRRSDGKGRHTTTARALIELPGGALLIDTPGMRELQPWEADAGLDTTFEDIVALARDCRFADCQHQSEPGCAVLDAVDRRRIDAARLEHYRHLLREAAFEERKHDKAAAAETKRRWKKIAHAQRKLYEQRDRE